MFNQCASTIAALLLLLASQLSSLPATAENTAPVDSTLNSAGVVVHLYDIGESMKTIPDLLPNQLPNLIKRIPTIDLKSQRGDFAPFSDRFYTEIHTLLAVPEAGEYEFRMISDDGSRFYINDALVIDHDGLHGAVPKDATIRLSADRHSRIRIEHFEESNGEELSLMWRKASRNKESTDEFKLIPKQLLFAPSDLSMQISEGKKRILPALRRGRPGDGRALDEWHPGYEFTFIEDEDQWRRRVREERQQAEVKNEPDFSVALFNKRGTTRFFDFSSEDSNQLSSSAYGIYVPDDMLSAATPSVAVIGRGVHAGQCTLGGLGETELKRVSRHRSAEAVLQGCVFRFAAIPHEVDLQGAATSYSLKNAMPGVSILLRRNEYAWHGRLKAFLIAPKNAIAFEMLDVQPLNNGIEIEFTKPLLDGIGWNPKDYYIEQWAFDPADATTAPARTGKRTLVQSASVSKNRKRVFLQINDLKVNQVLYLRLLPPCLSEAGEVPWSTEAWLTLRHLPNRGGQILQPPVEKPLNTLTPEEKANGWTLLFDGKFPNRWVGYGQENFPKQGWNVEDGCLVRVGSGGDIMTRDSFSNFELKLEWRISAGGNSGIFYRVDPTAKYPWTTGPEMQVLDNSEHRDGQNTNTAAGANYALHAPIRDVTRPVGLFNDVRIVVQGNHVEHWLNGTKIVEYELCSEAWKALVAESKFRKMPRYGTCDEGHIVLQDHGDKVWYRNIKIRRLD